LSGSGSPRSPSPCAAKARQPPRARPPPGPTLRFAPGPLWFRDSGPGTRIKAIAYFNLVPRATDPVQRLKTIEVDWGTHASASVLMPASWPARRTEKGIYTYTREAAADAAASVVVEAGIKLR